MRRARDRLLGLPGRFAGLVLVVLCLSAAPAFALKLEVKVEGLEGVERENVLGLLAIYQERTDETLSEPRLRVLHRLAPEQIREALAPFGLYRVEVQDRLDAPADAKGTWVASYRVTPGPAVKIGSVNYEITGEGAENPAFPKEFPMKVGDVLLHSEYEKAKSDIRYAASANGYLDYELVRHEVLVDPIAYDALVDFQLDTGPRYYLGEVRFKQDLLDDELLQRYVGFKPGDVYDPDVLIALQSRLLGSEYYDDVEIVPLKDPDTANNTVPIEVVAHRNKANKYRFGVGYASDVGPRISVDWRRRYVNRWGHKFRAELSLAPALSFMSFDYRIPVGNPVQDYITIKPEVSVYDNATRKGSTATVQAAHSVITPRGWRRTAGIDYQFENYDINETGNQQVNELVPNISWSKTVSDDPIFTTNGYRLKYVLLGAVEGITSNATYLSGAIFAKYIRGFAEKYRFITRAEVGATMANSVDDLPASRRFYAGGDSSIRGWGFDTLGPNDALDQTVGGRYLAVGSLELEREITGPWSAAIFTDFGNAFDPDYEQQFEQSVGVGLRWRSPIGQVRLDVAFALTKGEGDGAFGLPPARLHLVIGPDL